MLSQFLFYKFKTILKKILNYSEVKWFKKKLVPFLIAAQWNTQWMMGM